MLSLVSIYTHLSHPPPLTPSQNNTLICGPFQTLFLLLLLSVTAALHLRAAATVTGVVTPVATATAVRPPFAVSVNAKDSTPV
jgi:hypothetical protein